MLVSLLLTGVLAAQTPPPRTASPAPPSRAEVPVAPLPPTMNEAAELAFTGRLEDALEAYQRIAAANPADHAARLGVADMQMRLGRYDKAETVYRSLWLEDPSSTRAAVGVAESLGNRRRFEEAIEVLEAAEQKDPDHGALLASLGRMHTELGHGRQARAYLVHAAEVDPSDRNRARLVRAQAAHDHRVELAGVSEQFDGTAPDSRGVDLKLQLRLADRLRVSGRGQWLRKFGIEDTRGGAGVEWRWARASYVFAEALHGAGNRVMPVTEGFAGVEHRLSFGTGRLGLRLYDFDGTAVMAVEPAVTWFVNDRTTLDLRYDYTSTNLPRPLADVRNHHGLARGTRVLVPWLSVLAGYARGIENFDALSVDRINAFRAHTASAGVRLTLPFRAVAEGVYEYQWRDSGREMQRATVTLGHRF